MRIEVPMPSFEAVAPGQQALVRLPIGRRYHHLYLSYSGITLAQMTEIRLKLNGKVFQTFSGVERDVMNQFKGLSAANGILQIPFDRIGLKQRGQEELTAISTGVADGTGRAINSFTMEIDISDAAAAPVLSLRATQSAVDATGPGLIMNIRKESRAIGGAGELEVSDYLRGTPVSQSINSLYAFPSAGTIQSVEIERNLTPIWERDVALNEKIQTDGERFPQAGVFVVDTTELGYGGNNIGLVGIQDFRITYECSEQMSVRALIEYMGQLGN